MNTLYIAEKPSLAREIAGALSEIHGQPERRGDGFISVGTDTVTWFFGHMFQQAQPGEYRAEWAKWSLSSLPIVLRADEWRLSVPDDKRKQVSIVEKLARQAQTIVNAGDAGREGQLLVDEALVAWGIDPHGSNVRRLWSQTVTRRDLVAAVRNLLPNADKRGLYLAALVRQRADWQHGMTYSRLYTLLARQGGSDAMISVGRVQTPTLRIVVDRDNLRAGFKSVDHFIPDAAVVHQGGQFRALFVIPDDMAGLDSEGRLVDRAAAEAVCARSKGQAGRVTSFTVVDKSKAAPLPFSLSALQAECGSKLGLTAKETLEAAQSLYEKKLTSYPRSDSRHLPLSILSDEAPGILDALAGVPDLSAGVVGVDRALKSAAWNDAKISDHYAIIPTGEFRADKLAGLSDSERAVFLLVARAFIAQFHPAYRYQSQVAVIQVGADTFRATGRRVLADGWRAVMASGDDDEEGEDMPAGTLPTMAEGDAVQVGDVALSAKRTSPPPAFSDQKLIAAMASAHLFEPDPELRKRLKEGDGIGREATRADIIETLLKRGFLSRKGRTGLESTPLGRSVIAALPSHLTSLGLTARWEGAMEQVEGGGLTLDAVLDAQVTDITSRVDAARGSVVRVEGGKPAASKVKPLPGDGKACPECRKGVMKTKEITSKKDGKKYVLLSCTNYPECKHSEWPAKTGSGKKAA
ncbi:DNA topoisomerase III [Nguyenibacter sp. L1]|uniref:DNA topoisomerase III n=1 Tax=Nguyenibacter sp. L1 TaxID=3049350 RepID=UPI002B462D2D|nr:DNA topoisomerase III [Nguyenibacter sp. L1]WRH89567.1 DNA topoisomerase III [Nguyenibacter sp. L1]